MTGRITGAIAVTLAAVTTLTGCGSSSAPGSTPAASQQPRDALEVITAAASANAAVRSVHMSGSMTQQMHDLRVVAGQPAVNGASTADFDGVIQLKPLAGRIQLSNVEANGTDVGEMSELITRRAFYLKMPQLAAQTGKPWLEIRLAELSGASGLNFQQMLSQAEQMQPGQYVQELTKAGDLHEVGTETLRGVATTHYAGTVPVADALSRYTGTVRSQMASLLRAAGLRSTKVDVWLDGKGLVRRVESTAHGAKMSMTVNLDMLAYDVNVDVSPPPASQVVDLGDLQ